MGGAHTEEATAEAQPSYSGRTHHRGQGGSAEPSCVEDTLRILLTFCEVIAGSTCVAERWSTLQHLRRCRVQSCVHEFRAAALVR